MTRYSNTDMSRRTFIASTAGASLIALHPFSARAASGQAHLRIMETTDLHVHVWPYDYYSDKPRDTLGLARTAAHMADIRAEATNSMLLDNGDLIQGNPMGDYIAYERGMKDGDLHPIIEAMNVLGYDAATIGNHEFNYGLDFLTKSTAGAKFPWVLANVTTKQGAAPRDDTTLYPPYVILDRTVTDGAGGEHQIKVGIIGFTPPQIMNWDRRHLEGNVEVRDIVATAEAYVPEIREAGADIIIALSHSGIGAETGEMLENASVPLAGVDGVDAIMTGHHHLVFPGPNYEASDVIDPEKGTLHGKPAVMGGFWGSHLGVIDLMLEKDGSTWRVVSHESTTRPISKRNEDRSITALVESDEAVLEATKQEHEETLAYVRRAVGKTAAPLHSYFALVADDPSVQIVSIAQKWYVGEMLAGTEYAGLPILSAAAPFKAGGRGGPEYYTDVPVGDVAIKNVADLYLYPNTVRAVKVTGKEVRDWLERSAGMFNQVEKGSSDTTLLNPSFPSYNFDVIDGVTYQIDLSEPSKYGPKGEPENMEANRIKNLMYNGQPVTDDMEFVIATNNYRASGGGSFPGADGSTIIFEAPDTNRDVIVRYIVEQGTIEPTADANWTFTPLDGATVLFETGPKAADYVDQLKSVDIAPAGDGADGFALFRLKL
ncbi:MAG: bifunctional 2',3'-cyclic-nucleotide 2'-phosphodiesterase/3'-nucleotidase [Silicimonas sp.]|nr:bifunctional 2',3'-cyclic-nucleotide 2'-phosphodiesterase/3'-nucleotidase [Silicimonas sp.]